MRRRELTGKRTREILADILVIIGEKSKAFRETHHLPFAENET